MFICQWFMNSHLLLQSALLLIRVRVFQIHFVTLLLFLLLFFVSVVTSYHYKPHFHIQGIPTTHVSHVALTSLEFASWWNSVTFILLRPLALATILTPCLGWAMARMGKALGESTLGLSPSFGSPIPKWNSWVRLLVFARDFCWWQSSYDLNMFGL